jgi:hypothetical protein
VVGGRVGARVAGSEEGGDRLSGSAGPMVDEGRKRVVSVGFLPGRGRVLFVGVCAHKDTVEVDGDLTVGVRGVVACQRPDPVADFGPSGPNGLQSPPAGSGKSVDQTGDGRVGSNRTEDGRLAPQHRDVREAVPAERDRQGHVQQDLARIVEGPRFPPWRERCRYRGVQTGLADRLDQQHRAGLGDHPTATVLHTDTRVGPGTLLHLGSASFAITYRTSASPIVAAQRHFLLS